VKLAKRLRKEKVNVDVVNFGEEVCLFIFNLTFFPLEFDIWLGRLTRRKVEAEDTLYSTLSANPVTEALRCGTRFQGITQFYLPPIHLSTNGMNTSALEAFQMICAI